MSSTTKVIHIINKINCYFKRCAVTLKLCKNI